MNETRSRRRPVRHRVVGLLLLLLLPSGAGLSGNAHAGHGPAQGGDGERGVAAAHADARDGGVGHHHAGHHGHDEGRGAADEEKDATEASSDTHSSCPVGPCAAGPGGCLVSIEPIPAARVPGFGWNRFGPVMARTRVPRQLPAAALLRPPISIGVVLPSLPGSEERWNEGPLVLV